jgi:hypothetical protein
VGALQSYNANFTHPDLAGTVERHHNRGRRRVRSRLHRFHRRVDHSALRLAPQQRCRQVSQTRAVPKDRTKRARIGRHGEIAFAALRNVLRP